MPPSAPPRPHGADSAARHRSPLAFFAWTLALSLPFWVVGSASGLQLLPGLPLSGLMTFCPMAAALILVGRDGGSAGVRMLLKRSFDYERIRAKAWYAPIILLMPGIMLVSYAVARLMGTTIPTPDYPALAPLLMFVAFFVAAEGEELGWSGYVTEPMLARGNALLAAILLGLVWAAWHLVPFVQAHRSPLWIAGQCLQTVATRVLLVWLYQNTDRSVFATVLYHTMLNLSQFLFPVYGSHYDPLITGPLLAIAAAIVACVWGPRTLAGGPGRPRAA